MSGENRKLDKAMRELAGVDWVSPVYMFGTERLAIAEELGRLRGKLSEFEDASAEVQGIDEENHNLRLRVKELEAKLRAGFSEAEEAYLDTLTDEVGKREEMIRELHGQLSCLCAAIESHPFEQENDFVKQERERARKLLGHYDVSEMAKPPLRHWDGCTGRCCKGK